MKGEINYRNQNSFLDEAANMYIYAVNLEIFNIGAYRDSLTFGVSLKWTLMVLQVFTLKNRLFIFQTVSNLLNMSSLVTFGGSTLMSPGSWPGARSIFRQANDPKLTAKTTKEPALEPDSQTHDSSSTH